MKGKIFFISGPSGVGKGTLIKALKERHPEWVFPPSYSTRSMRPGEGQGDPYYFVSVEEFQRKINHHEFLEYAHVHGDNFYGTDRDSLFVPAEKGQIVVKEFDVQGYTQIMEKLDKSLYTSIFLNVSGGADELIRRIQNRSPISSDELTQRMQSMIRELKMERYYDHTVLNDDIETMVVETENIILDK
jgi:guanylate kinase